jgi:hypothetical protein
LIERFIFQYSKISLDNYDSIPELFNLLNQLHTDADRIVRSNSKVLPKDVMNCNLKKGEVAVSYRNKLMALNWKDKKDAEQYT